MLTWGHATGRMLAPYTRGMKWLVVSAVLLSLVLLGGCGDDDRSSDPSASDGSASARRRTARRPRSRPRRRRSRRRASRRSTPTETTEPLPDWPACADVWVVDAKLPGDYQGCLEERTAVKAKNQYCEFGKKLVTYADQFWAVRGGKVNDAKGPLEGQPGLPGRPRVLQGLRPSQAGQRITTL